MRGRDSLSLLAAFLLHAGGVVAARALAPQVVEEHVRTGAGEENDAVLLLDVDVSPDGSRAPEDLPMAQPQALARTSTGPGSARGTRAERATPSAHAPVLPEAPSQAPSSGPAAGEDAPPDPDAYGAPPPAAAPPGLGGVPVWALPGVLPGAPPAGSLAAVRPLAPVRPAPPRSARSGADPGGGAPALVFPAAGTLASAVADEVSSSAAPDVSESSFELTLNAKGQLVSVRFLDANAGNGEDWRRIAQAVLRRFSGRTLSMNGDFAAGGKVTVHVSSRVVMPDGTEHGIPKPMMKHDAGKSIVREDSLDDRFRLPHLAPAPGEKKPMLAFRFDLANLGAQRRRVVNTRVDAVPVALP
ncbi:hypothetical protein SOCE26_010930 [Sorangium cellulosum]|uniref:Uncharacterized protein n=1 Tax=Sorangium cellulosum TaxID=56 RepID=A0A2L0EKA1_SORCE|nr:hypothetical protein [Sorangium cellulosum]AUX39698.1 hypothetical protein SOCE26_010930 [Sorangium cellulosum]